jgi:hypothetical protein
MANPTQLNMKNLSIENGYVKTAIFVGVAIIWLILSYGWIESYPIDKAEQAGQLGDAYGKLNSLISALTVAGLIVTILLQRKAMNDAKADAVSQNQFQDRQQFEATFFKMLSLHFKIVESMNLGYKDSEGLNSLQVIIIDFSDKISNNSFIRNPIDNDLETSYEYHKVKDFDSYQTAFKDRIDFYDSNISQYLQSIRALYEFIKYTPVKSVSENHYFILLNGYISLTERIFLYYYVCLAETSPLNTSIRKMANDLPLFQSLKKVHMRHGTHEKIFEDYQRSTDYHTIFVAR